MAQFKDELVIMHDATQFPADYAKDHAVLDFAGFSKNAKITKVTNPGLGIYIVEGAKPFKTIFGEMEAQETQDINGNKKYFVNITDVPEGLKIEVLAARFDAGRDVWYGSNPTALAAGDYFKIAVMVDSVSAVVAPPVTSDPKDIVNADGSIIHSDGSFTFPDGYAVQNAYKWYPDGTVLDIRTPLTTGGVTRYADGSLVESPSTARVFPNQSTIHEDGTWFTFSDDIMATRLTNGVVSYSDGFTRSNKGQLYNKAGNPVANDNIHVLNFNAWAAKSSPYPHVYKDGSYLGATGRRLFQDSKLYWQFYRSGEWLTHYYIDDVKSTFELSTHHVIYEIRKLNVIAYRDVDGVLHDADGTKISESKYSPYYLPRHLEEALQHYGYPFDPQW